MMKCPKCKKETSVKDTRYVSDNSIRRRRECINRKCRERFTTFESIASFDVKGMHTHKIREEATRRQMKAARQQVIRDLLTEVGLEKLLAS